MVWGIMMSISITKFQNSKKKIWTEETRTPTAIESIIQLFFSYRNRHEFTLPENDIDPPSGPQTRCENSI